MSSLSKAIVKQVTARVFGCPTAKKLGGNPVTVFVWDEYVTKDDNRFEKLAQTCSWESVHVAMTNHHRPIFYFYMPSGERVSFCAHAAMGASAVIVNNDNEQEKYKHTHHHFNFITEDPSIIVHTAKVDTQPLRVELEMDCTHFEEQLLNTTTQIDCLKQLVSQIGLEFHQDVVHHSLYLPTCRNSTVARYKTLIPIVSLEKLHAAKNPNNSDKFRDLCDSINSTGLYLYCPMDSHSKTYECRQFPRASGYPEDPATGIAASALACSLRKLSHSSQSSTNDCDIYQIYQGTAMGRRSLIEIKFENGIQQTAKLLCSGNVNIDSTKTLEY